METKPGIKAQWKCGNKEIESAIKIRNNASKIFSFTLSQHTSGEPQLSITLPITNIAGVWMPYSTHSSLQTLLWREHIPSAPYFRPPLVSFVDGMMCNQLLIFALLVDNEIDIRWALDQAAACYRIEIRWLHATKATSPKVLISTERKPIHECVPKIIESATEISADFLPVKAFHYEPAYCTWYAFHADLSQNTINSCVGLAKKLGFGTFILDDGWSYNEPQRVGSALGEWHRFAGDWKPSHKKFPNFSEHVQHVKDLGLRYLLWVAPYLVGRKSRAFSRLKKNGALLDSWLKEGYSLLDPRNPAMVADIECQLLYLVQNYPIDGFKVDYDYGLLGPDSELQGVGPAYVNALAKIITSIKKIRPDFEYNLPPNFTSLSNPAARCVDVPFDAATNRMHLGNLKIISGRKALQSDPCLWTAADSVEMVHRHLVPTIFGTPSIGAPLLNLPKTHHEIIRDWLSFYRRHQDILNLGQFTPTWVEGNYQSFKANRNMKMVAAIFSCFPMNIELCHEAMIINAGYENNFYVNVPAVAMVCIETAQGRKIAKNKRITKGLQKIACPVGGIARLEFNRN